ncbi:MAG: FAD-dependent oxidoreductase [Fimbriimonadaceae bacterium]
MTQLECDVCIVGGGTGGTAAALALAEHNLRIIVTESTDWIGGQLTAQAVPPDENPWIESTGCTASYRDYRNRVRKHYRLFENLTPQAAQNPRLNPGSGWVSHLCHSPAIGHQVLREMLALEQNPNISLLIETIPIQADTNQSEVISIITRNTKTGEHYQITAKFFLDATELGDLLPLTQTEYNLGSESKSQTGEPNATDYPNETENVQSFTWCAALAYDEDADYTIDKPEQYDFWANYQPPNWPDKLLSFSMLHVQRGQSLYFPLFENDGFNLFTYRQITQPDFHTDNRLAATIMNWPMNDYDGGTVIDVPVEEAEKHYDSAKHLTLSMLYWLQIEKGYKGLRFAPEHTGTPDGLAKSAYIRESRRIKALHTICEQDVAAYTNPGLIVAPEMPKSVGIGAYRIDLHPSANGRPTLDTSTLPFQIPLGSLIPERTKNLLAACKNLGVTHITNGCYRLHPVEWNIGESAGILAAFCITNKCSPHQVQESDDLFSDYQNWLWQHGVLTDWPRLRPL